MSHHEELKPRRDESLRLLHHHPGYLRVQADAFLGEEEEDSVVAKAKRVAEEASGFRKCSHNPKTGSLVVEYEPGKLDTDELLARLARKTGLDGVVVDEHSTRHRRELVSGFLDTVQELNGIVSQVTAQRADLRELVPAALAATSVVSFILGDRASVRVPRWDSALYRGYRIFMQWHRSEVREREEAGRRREEKEEEERHVHGEGA
jgi:hypothetical protein